MMKRPATVNGDVTMLYCVVCNTAHPPHHVCCTRDGAVLVRLGQSEEGRVIPKLDAVVEQATFRKTDCVVFSGKKTTTGARITLVQQSKEALEKNPQRAPLCGPRTSASFEHPHLVRVLTSEEKRWYSLNATTRYGYTDIAYPHTLQQALGYTMQLWSVAALLQAHDVRITPLFREHFLFVDPACTQLQLFDDERVFRIPVPPLSKQAASSAPLPPFIEYAAMEETVGGERSRSAFSEQSTLATVLYEELTNEFPFAGDSPTDAMLAIVQNKLIPPTKRMPSLPAGVDVLFARMREPKPANRFRDLHEAILALRELFPEEIEQWFAYAQPKTLLEVLLRPDRSRFALYQADVPMQWLSEAPTAHSAEAWKLFQTRERVPPRWGAFPQRRFAGPSCLVCKAQRGRHPNNCHYCWSAGSLERETHPHRLMETIASACDWLGMGTAEKQAHAFLEAMKPWGVPQPTEVCWTTEDLYGTWEPPLIGFDWAAVRQWLDANQFPRPALAERIFRDEGVVAPLSNAMRSHFDLIVHAQAAWSLCPGRERLFSVPPSKIPDPATTPNPFDSLLALLGTGYLLRAIHPHELVLAMPTI